MWLPLLLILGIPSCFFIAAFVIGCFEKHPVRMFDTMQLASVPMYTAAMMQTAASYGFQFRTSGFHTKFKEKLIGVLLLSADYRILAIIGEGKIIGMNSRKTILLSRLSDGRMIVTIDEAGTAELDPGTQRQIIMNADFPQLLQKHQETLVSLGLPQTFAPDCGWEAVDELYRERASRMVAAGMANFADAQQDFIRYTPWGSFKASVLHGIGQILYPPNHWRHLKRRPG